MVGPAALPAEPASGWTPRVVVAGLLVGTLLTVINVYLLLRLGLCDSGNGLTALVAPPLLAALGRRRSHVTEANLVTTIAPGAAGAAQTTGVTDALPALVVLGIATPPLWSSIAFGAALGLAATWILAPFVRPLVEDDRLPVPTGRYTSEILRAAHDTASGDRSTRVLVAGASVAGAVVLLRDALGWIRDLVWPWSWFGWSPRPSPFGIAASPGALGIGLLSGPSIAASVAIGAGLAWGLLGPWLVGEGLVGAEPREVGEWLRVPAITLLLAASFTDLGVQAWRGRRGAWAFRVDRGDLAGIGIGVVMLIVAITLAYRVFLLPLPSIGLSVLFALPLSLVCARAAAETDWSPGEQMSFVAKLGLRSAGGTAPATLVLGGLTTSGMQWMACLLLWAQRTGLRVGAQLRPQVYAQAFGVVFGSVVAVATYAVISARFGVGNELFPAPGGVVVAGVAKLLAGGTLPPGALVASGWAAALGVGLTLSARRLPFPLSPVAMSIGMIIGVKTAMAVAIGGLVAWLAMRVGRGAVVTPVGAGFLAAEPLFAIGVAVVQLSLA